MVADVMQPSTLAQLPPAETVLYAVGYDPRGGRTRCEIYVDGLRNTLAALPGGPERIIFVSSTGVYGQDDGSWVDEDSPCRPTHDSGRALLAAEAVLHEHPLGSRGVVLRLAGIYGPGRLPRRPDLVAVHRGLAIPAESVANLIHVDDAATVVLAAEQPRPAAANVSRLRRPSRPAERVSFLSRGVVSHIPAATCPRRNPHVRGKRKPPRRRQTRQQSADAGGIGRRVGLPDLSPGPSQRGRIHGIKRSRR